MLIVFAVLKKHGRSAIERLHRFQQGRLAPFLIAYATHPLHTLFMMLVWLAILILSNVTAVALLGGNYFNGLAGIIGCLTLASVGAAHAASQARHDEHSQKLDNLMQAHRSSHAVHSTRLSVLEHHMTQLTEMYQQLATIVVRDGAVAEAGVPDSTSSNTAQTAPTSSDRRTARSDRPRSGSSSSRSSQKRPRR